jgi:hypothetical protein
MVDEGDRVHRTLCSDASPQMSAIVEELTLEISNSHQCGRLLGGLQRGATEVAARGVMATGGHLHVTSTDHGSDRTLPALTRHPYWILTFRNRLLKLQAAR